MQRIYMRVHALCIWRSYFKREFTVDLAFLCVLILSDLKFLYTDLNYRGHMLAPDAFLFNEIAF